MEQEYIGVKVPKDLKARIKQHSVERQMTHTDVIKEALYNYFRDEAETDRLELIIKTTVGKCECRILSRLDDFWNAGNQ